jgi:hypothetical protein
MHLCGNDSGKHQLFSLWLICTPCFFIRTYHPEGRVEGNFKVRLPVWGDEY